MLITNREDYKNDLMEVINAFDGANLLDITHEQKTVCNFFYDKITLGGEKAETFNFENKKEYNGEIELKRYEKRFSKLSIYNVISNFLGVTLPWGALTGIRPVKLAYTTGENFESEFKNLYGVSSKKISIIKDIISVQKTLVDKSGEYCDFFVGIPFCPSRCAYCSFISEEIGKSKYINEYVNALVYEIENAIKISKPVRSVYIGGGTPVALSELHLEKILKAVSPVVKNAVEFTVEAGRPDVITAEKLQLFKKYGVTRVSVNPQTFDDKTLKLIGRNHTASDIFEKFELVKKFGFIINADLIAGLPGEDFNDFKYSVDTAISLNAENITVHTLCLKKGSKLKEKVERLRVNEVSDMVDYAYDSLKTNGYLPYYLYRQKYTAGNLENTGYAKKGYECVYNANVMEEFSDNVASGANAVSKKVFASDTRIERYGAPKDVKTYIDKIEEIVLSKFNLFKG